MLTLARKVGQSIVIGNDIVVTVKDVRGKTVRLAIETPAGTVVNREEIHRAIVEENRRAASAPQDLDARFKRGSLARKPAINKTEEP